LITIYPIPSLTNNNILKYDTIKDIHE